MSRSMAKNVGVGVGIGVGDQLLKLRPSCAEEAEFVDLSGVAQKWFQAELTWQAGKAYLIADPAEPWELLSPKLLGFHGYLPA